jgi:hypothetical protein
VYKKKCLKVTSFVYYVSTVRVLPVFTIFFFVVKLPSKTWELKFTIDNSPVFNNIILRKNVPKTLHFGVKNVSNEIVQVSTVQIKQSTPDVQFNPVTPYNLPPSILMQHDLKVCCKTEGILYFPILIFAQIGDRSRQFAVELVSPSVVVPSVEKTFQVFHTHDESLDDLHPVAPFKRTTRAVLKERIETVDRGQRANLYVFHRSNKTLDGVLFADIAGHHLLWP